MNNVYHIRETQEQIDTLNQSLKKKRKEDLNIIIKKLFEHPIAINDVHYEFLKEIEQDLREYDFIYNF